MHLTKTKDVKVYWKLLDKLECDNTKKTHTNISTNQWLDHYRSLLQGNKSSNNFPNDVPKSGPLDYMIAMEEMMNAASILKKAGKATGIDNISNEMIFAALTLYPHVFLHIFNTILNNNGDGISKWSISLVVPFHKKRF